VLVPRGQPLCQDWRHVRKKPQFALFGISATLRPYLNLPDFGRHVRSHILGADWASLPRPDKPQITFLIRKLKLGGGGATQKVNRVAG
jgi:hypothetical protein